MRPGQRGGGLCLVRREGRSLDEGRDRELLFRGTDRGPRVGRHGCCGGPRDSSGGAPIPESSLEIEPDGVSGGGRKARRVEDGPRTEGPDAAGPCLGVEVPVGDGGRGVQSPAEPSGRAGGAAQEAPPEVGSTEEGRARGVGPDLLPARSLPAPCWAWGMGRAARVPSPVLERRTLTQTRTAPPPLPHARVLMQTRACMHTGLRPDCAHKRAHTHS